jgi:hypothetical protein
MSEHDSIFDDGCISAEDHTSSSEVPQTGIRPSIHGASPSPAPRIKCEEVLQPSIEVDIKTEKVGGFFITPEPGKKPDRTPIITSEAFHMDYVPGHSKEESHKDCMIIDEDECSTEARQKWSEDPVMKLESDLQAAAVANPIAAQIIMMRRFRNQQRNGEKRSGRDKDFLSSSHSRPRRSASYDPIIIEDEDMEKLETNMRYHDDDDKWMDPDAGAGEVDEIDNLTALRDSLEERQRLKRLSKTEAIQLVKLSEKIEVRKRREEIAKQPMFISDDDDLDADASDEEERRNRQSIYNQDAEVSATSPMAALSLSFVLQPSASMV